MTKASNIVSWIGGALTTITEILLMALGIDVPVQHCYLYYPCRIIMEHYSFPSWLWIPVIIGALIRLVILIFRPYQYSEVNKIGYGVITLIFVSLVGGILTFCIPKRELHLEYVPSSAAVASSDDPDPSKENDESDEPEPTDGPFNEGDRVRLAKEPIKTPDGEIPVGSIGVVTVPNSRGEPEVTFEELGIKVRVQERYLRKAEEE